MDACVGAQQDNTKGKPSHYGFNEVNAEQFDILE